MPFYRFRNGFRAWKNKLNEKFEDNEKEKKRKERNKKSEKPKDAAKKIIYIVMFYSELAPSFYSSFQHIARGF